MSKKSKENPVKRGGTGSIKKNKLKYVYKYHTSAREQLKKKNRKKIQKKERQRGSGQGRKEMKMGSKKMQILTERWEEERRRR